MDLFTIDSFVVETNVHYPNRYSSFRPDVNRPVRSPYTD